MDLLRRLVWGLFDPEQGLGLRENSVRAILGVLVVLGVFIMLWTPFANGEHWAPKELVVLWSAVMAFYFTNPEA